MSLNHMEVFLLCSASLVLFGLAITIGLLVVYGWQKVQEAIRENSWHNVQAAIRENVAAVTDDKIRKLEYELRGRVLTILGHVQGELSMQTDSLKWRDLEGLSEAVNLCQQGYRFLREVGGAAESLALNNLVFYSCALQDESQRSFLLDKARILKAEGEEHQSTTLLLTSCRVLLQYGAAEEKEEACKIVSALERKPISIKERREAQLYLEKFCDRKNPPKSP